MNLTRSALHARVGAILIFAGAFSAGCAPARLLDRPLELPEAVGGRRLWHTPHAYIYAADATVAGETDRWVAGLSAHIRRTYKKELGKGLVIVVDRGEPPVVYSLEELHRLEGMLPALGTLSRGAPMTLERRRARLAESGMSEEQALRVTPAPLDGAALASAGFAGASTSAPATAPRIALPADVAWMMSCPSNRMAEAATWEIAPAAVEKRKGKMFAVMTACVLPLAIPEAAKAFQLARDSLCFQLWAARLPDWTDEKRAAESGRYMKERAFLLSPVLALALAMAQEGKEPASGE